MKEIGWTLALALAATAAGAATPSPATFDSAGIGAWLQEHIDWEGWTFIAADQQAAAFGGPDGVDLLADGTLRAVVRREYYREDNRIGGRPIRSLVMRWIVDCEGRQYRAIAAKTFSDSNLTGPIDSYQNSDARWLRIPPNSQNEQVRSRICEAPTKGREIPTPDP